MPQTAVKNSDQLGIRLNRTDQTYIPGETISGQVFRKNHIVSSKATVRITLHARSKSRMVVSHGHITSTNRGRFDLVNSADYTKTIFHGPLHIPTDGTEQSWPFALQLPTNVDMSALESSLSQDQSYLSLKTELASTYRLPPTFSTEDYQYMSGMSAFVEYFLQAELKTSSRGSTNVIDAILPFKVLHVNVHEGPSLKTLHHNLSIPSNNLMAEEMNAGAMQQTAGLPGASTDPTLAFDIQVKLPTVLLANDPEPVPFSLLAILDLSKRSGNVQYDSQEILITHIAMKIVARTEVKCVARKTTRQADNQTIINLHAEEAYHRYGNSLIIPWKRPATEELGSQEDPHVSEAAPTEPLHVGEKLNLRLERREGLYSTFQTYNIKHTHRLKWELAIQVAQTTFELSGEDDVKILTSPELERSTEWIQPPTEDHLPSFSEYQESTVESDATRSSHKRETWLGGVGGLSRLWAF